jgi:hypothetical protein
MGKRKKKDLIEDIEFGVILSRKGREDGSIFVDLCCP